MKVACVGCGYWGKNYVRVLHELARERGASGVSSDIIVCDRDQELLDAIRGRFPAIQVTRELDDVLGDEAAVDALIVATPASTHYAIVKQCLAAKKHVLVEKPLTLKAEEAVALSKMAEGVGRTLMVGHTFLFNAKVHKLKDLVRQKDFGSLYYLNAKRTNMGPIRSDTSVVWDLAPHDVSIFQYVMDGEMPTAVSATGHCFLGNEGRPDVAFLTLIYGSSGVAGHIHVSWIDPNKVREVFAVGSGKRVSCDDMDNSQPIKIYEKGVTITRKDEVAPGVACIRDGDIIIPTVKLFEPLKAQTAAFVEAAAAAAGDGGSGGSGSSGSSQRPLVSDGPFGAQVVRILEAAERSIALGGASVDIADCTETKAAKVQPPSSDQEEAKEA